MREIHERLLITFLLAQSGILQRPVLYLSHFFRRRRAEYYEHLQAGRDSGDWENWLLFFLRGVDNVSQEATARRILFLREEHRDAVTRHFGLAAGNGHRILDTLYQQPYISVATAREVIGTTYATANSIVSRLTDMGILEEVTGHKRNRTYCYDPYVRILAES